MEGQKPTVGRFVHYTNLGDADVQYPPVQLAAIITSLYEDETVALKVFTTTGMHDVQRAERSQTHERGKWTWPPRASPSGAHK